MGLLNRRGAKALRLAANNLFRVMSTNDSSKQQDPCSSKPEPCSPPPTSACPEPPPCPPMPQCPPTICPSIPDPGNPCNYCPPPCVDPETPDLTRLKKLQCFFQKDEDTPVFLRGGKMDVFLYQIIILLTIVGLVGSYLAANKLMTK